ncbi:hypothetical protein ACOQ0N_004265 [Vibrio parahaemolyticus]|nr:MULTISPECIES: hypothetical protein [Vibrio harveyi group]AHJ02698.1 hypothetical protein VPUCM_p0021 [Vibrio parahaemolyticus UCM-V493]MCR9651463.1 hypothetical protein [Vibrio parahaemolyticus]MCR9802918.1 hypothetical protein [Vibrio parahaemolyticus]MCZ5870464.1 hypothetical protein [Vibrio parahaemolyticus]MCZ5900865.1 hypothetical protein [Vibrio parahaemolyticus]
MCNRSRDRKRDTKQADAIKRRREARDTKQMADEFAKLVKELYL